jgi:hypothetical protein
MMLSGELYAPAVSPQEKNPVPIEYEAGWTREPVWMFGEEKNSLASFQDSKHELASQ